jgi:hypothetical protein
MIVTETVTDRRIMHHQPMARVELFREGDSQDVPYFGNRASGLGAVEYEMSPAVAYFLALVRRGVQAGRCRPGLAASLS